MKAAAALSILLIACVRESPARQKTALTALWSLIGTAPSADIRFDGNARLFSGASFSDDGGRTWSALTSGGRRGVLLGGPRVVRPSAGPNGRILFGELLFDEPGVAFGHGPIAHAVEWDGSDWNVLLAESEKDKRAPAIMTPAVAYDGTTPLIAAGSSILKGKSFAPGRVVSLLAARDGSIYVGVQYAGFGLYRAANRTSEYLPIPSYGAVMDLAESKTGIFAVGERFGCMTSGRWEWREWPRGFHAERVAAHPTAPNVAVAGNGRLFVSRDGGATLEELSAPKAVYAAAWDPRVSNSLLAVAHRNSLFRVVIEPPRNDRR